jgi:hypothetical protein
MSKWEYMCLEWYSSKQMNTNMLNALGGEGWELIQIVKGEAVLKRKLKEEKKSEKEENLFDSDDDFVDMIYSLYPTKCPKRGTSLGKSKKDKERIKKLLKTYTKEQIESVVRKEVDAKYNKEYMQNFSTFLNNFPDPLCVDENISIEKNVDVLKIGDIIYR